MERLGMNMIGRIVMVSLAVLDLSTAARTAAGRNVRSGGMPGRSAPAWHVEGNRIVAMDGTAVVLHGVSRSGAEYACVNGFPMAWADRHRIGYLPWTWNTPDHAGCQPNGGADGDMFVIAAYDSTPRPGMGVGFKAHLTCLAAGRCRVDVGRTYPRHTGIVATTFWVGEIFDPHAEDGSQVTSTYDAHWLRRYGGCDGNTRSGSCETERRTAANGFFPTRMTPRQNPFYLDLPFDDVNNAAAFAMRAPVIPWARDPGYAGHAGDASFSYMKNRWVAITRGGHTCYGQIEDAGPGQYADARYVFGGSDRRPMNRRFNGAGMDVSPALNGCLGFSELDGEDDRVAWRFVGMGEVPVGPWTKVVTTSPVDNS